MPRRRGKRAALIIARVKAGETPVPEPMKPVGGPTVAELAARYLTEYVSVRCKPSTAAATRSVVHRHIAPALGKMPLAAVERAQVAELHQRLYETPAVANAVVGALSSMYRLAASGAWSPRTAPNPCRSLVKYPERKRERFLTDKEFVRLGEALDEVEARGGATAPAVAAIRLLTLTGCRKSEILSLRWEDVALGESELRLPDTKTGARAVSLSPAAVKLLAGLPRLPGYPWVIPGRKPGTRLRNLDDAWRAVRARAGLEGVRIHDLRHSYARRALALGESLTMIGRLLGHCQIQTTARYAHLARDSVREAAERVAESIATDILGEGWRPASVS